MKKVRVSNGDSSWFSHDRFGLFIHWGLYALAARHEWVKQREEIPDEVYDIYFRHFNPDLYDPDLWAKTAAAAGMKYFVVTTKHHEGFCLWDSQYTDYKATRTPAGRDLLKPMVEAFRRQGLRVGFYHSLIDWHHPDFVIDDLHPLRNHPDRARLNKTRRQEKYAEYLHHQVRELLTNFGPVDIMWFDFSYPPGKHGRPSSWVGKGRQDWESEKLVKLVRSLQPKILLNDRLDWPEDWDIMTPEQYMPRDWPTVDGVPVVWEACHTFSGSWGYHRDEASWKSVEQLLTLLIEAVSKGGNFLLNVGPTARGEFDERALARLEGIGQWMRRHSRAIYGCTQAPDEFKPPPDCRLTYNPETNCLYVHILAWPFRHLHLDGYGKKVAYAQLLHDASEVKIIRDQKKPDDITLELPVLRPNVAVAVVELFLR
ncbi:MAG TPA: alpha-L-fucosidase [bacterium]|nr:alpha-L-fucosidase [bacterium]